MAGNNPFANIQDAPAEQAKPIKEPKQAPTATITDADRVALKVLFDSQPARRAAYGKKIGIEFDPNDQESFRPLGSPAGTPYDQTIRPDIGSYFRKGGFAEAVKRLGDFSWDTTVMAPLVAMGAEGGATTGAIMTAPAMGATAGTSAIIGPLAGGIAGSALGYTLSEATKNLVGDWVLKQDYVPPDYALTAAQGIIMGMAPEMLNQGAKLTKATIAKAWEARTEALKNLVQISGGIPNSEMVDYMAKNPSAFTKDAVKGGIQKLQGAYRSIFGLTENEFLTRVDKDHIAPESVFYPELEKARQAKSDGMVKLDKMESAEWTINELVKPFQSELDALKKNAPEGGGGAALNTDKKAAKKYFEDKIAEIYKDAAAHSGIDASDQEALGEVRMKYSYGDDVLTAVQNDAFKRELPGAPYLKQAITRQIKNDKNYKNLNPSEALGRIAAMKAEANGVPLQTANDRISQVIKTYNDTAQHLTPDNLGRAFTGKPGNTNYANVRQALSQTDAVLGTDLSSDTGMKGMQAWAEQQYMSGKAQKSPLQSMATSFVKGAARGGGIAGTIGAATGDAEIAKSTAILGAVADGTMSALQASKLANPSVAGQTLAKYSAQEQAAKALANKIPTLAELPNGLQNVLGNYDPNVADAITSLPSGLQQVKSMGTINDKAASMIKERVASPIQAAGALISNKASSKAVKSSVQPILDLLTPPAPEPVNPFAHINDDEEQK